MSLEEKITDLITAINRLNDSLNKLSLHRVANYCADKLIPLAKWNEIHQWPTMGALRNIVYNKHYNGATAFVVKLGRRVYIDQEKFFEWARGNPSFRFKSQ